MLPNEILHRVEKHWDTDVEMGCGFTIPALGLSREIIEDYIANECSELPGIPDLMEPRSLLVGIEGKDVLCLASGGGQQTAVFGLLGAKVTSLDLCQGQLDGDRTAAQHYGCAIRTIKGDAGDLSCLDDASYDLVYQAPGLSWMPDVQEVYRRVYRILRPRGSYRVAITNPAVHTVDFAGGRAGWNGIGYRIADPYRGGSVLKNEDGIENMEEGEPTGDHRHLFCDSVGGLIEAGFNIRSFTEDPHHLQPVSGTPGSWEHLMSFIGMFINIVAEK